jgi:general secretion pathway protein A
MFEKYFGLTENPFNLTPDPKYLFFSKVHKEALSHLKYGIDEKKGFVLITGEIGAGKTTLCRVLLTTLPDTIKTALILNPTLSDIELLQTINQEFGISSTSSSKKALLDELYGFLLDVRADNKNAVLIIDECQNLSTDVLEQIRMLSNLETEKEKLLQIVLIGQPELKSMLSTPSLKQINDRITVRYHMGLLNKPDTRDYIRHRLIISGSHGDIKFSRAALNRIYKFSSGLPRRINSACERSLLIAFTKGTSSITGPIARQAIGEITGESTGAAYFRKALAVAAALAIIAGVMFFWKPLLSLIDEKTGMAKPNEEISLTRQPDVRTPGPPAYDWIMKDYKTAINSLEQLPENAGAISVLNLHPPFDFLKSISKPFAASVWGGYVIAERIDNNTAELIKADGSRINIPLKNFSDIYQGHAFMIYKKNPSGNIFGKSSKGNGVKKVQEKLKELGYLSNDPNGVYDNETYEGIKKLQGKCGLTEDGIAGTETLTLIDMLKGEKI